MTHRYSTLVPILMLALAGALFAQGTVGVDRTTLNFAALVGSTTPVSQTLNITSSGSATMFLVQPNATWLTVVTSSTTTPATVTVTADPSSLPAQTYTSSLTVLGGTGTVQVTVNFMVSSIGVAPAALDFAFNIGGVTPASKNLSLTGQLTSFTAAASTTSDGNWLAIDRQASTSPGTLTVLINDVVLRGLTAGTYNGSVAITPSAGGSAGAITVPVTLTVSPAPPVTASPAQININFQNGGTNNQSQQALTLATTGNQTLSFSGIHTVDANPSGQDWIVVSPMNGVLPGAGSVQLQVGYDIGRTLPSGTYTGKVTVFIPGASPDHVDIPVRLLVSNQPLLSLDKGALNFTFQTSGPAPAAQSVMAVSTNVASGATTGQTVLAITVSTANGGAWLSAPTARVTGTAFSVSVDVTNLLPGKYTGTVTVIGVGAANNPQQVAVTLTVANDPSLQANTASLTFPWQTGQAAPAAQTITLASTGAPFTYTVTSTTSTTPRDCGTQWLAPGGSLTGTVPGSFTVGINTTGMTAGTCSGTVMVTAQNPLTGAEALGSPLIIPVTLIASTNPLLTAAPATSFTFSSPVDGATSNQNLTLGSTSPSVALNYSVNFTPVTGGNNWLTWGPQTGSTLAGSNIVMLSATPGLLSAGTYTGTLTITATNPGGAAVANSPISIPVSFQVTAGTLQLTPAALSFVQQVGGAAPAAQNMAVASSGQQLTYTAVASNDGSVNWLSVTTASTSGTTPGSIAVNADGSKLPAGTYQSKVTVSAVGTGGAPVAGSPVTVTVTLTVASTVAATPMSLTFSQISGGGTPQPQGIAVTGMPGPLTFAFSVATKDGVQWMSASSNGTTTPGSVLVSVNGGALAPATYTGTVTITSAGAIGSPIAVPVTLNVLPSQTLALAPASLAFAYTLGLDAPPAQTFQISSNGQNTQFTVSKATDTAAWLKFSPASGTAPGTITVTVDPKGLAAATYNGTLLVSSPNAVNPVEVNVTLTVSEIPKPVIVAVKNAASWQPGDIAPGENVVIGGTGIGPAAIAGAVLTSDGQVATTVADTQVMFGNVAAPLIYVSAGQTAVMVPYEVAGQPSVQVKVVYKGVASDPVTYRVAGAAPGFYTLNQAGSGPGVIFNQDYTVNGPAAPAAIDSVVGLYMTGEGLTQPASTTGGIAPIDGTGLNRPPLNVKATVGGVTAKVEYYGSAPGIIYGVMQVNVRIPESAPSGPQPILITLGTSTTAISYTTQQAVTVQVK